MYEPVGTHAISPAEQVITSLHNALTDITENSAKATHDMLLGCNALARCQCGQRELKDLETSMEQATMQVRDAHTDQERAEARAAVVVCHLKARELLS